MNESPLFWPVKFRGKRLEILDETRLPEKKIYIRVKDAEAAVNVIRTMKTRAFGQFLVVLNTFRLVTATHRGSETVLFDKIRRTAEQLNRSRPTFPFGEVTGIVVRWAQEAKGKEQPLAAFLEKQIQGFLQGIRYQREDRVLRLARLMKNGDRILTHCNVSGELAMAARLCLDKGKHLHFFATETRPYFQGAKLTCWELKKVGAAVTLVADNAVGTLLMDGLVNKVFIGSDRSCANGDVANKIGSYQIAVLAKEFGVPFYVMTQPSRQVARGEDIPIELREPDELLRYDGRKIVRGKVRGFYPGFDVVPASLISKSIAIDPKAVSR